MIHKKYTTKVLAGLLLLTAGLISSCSKTDDFSDSIVGVNSKPSIDFIALTSSNQLIRYNASNPSQSLGVLINIPYSSQQSSASLTVDKEVIVAIDYRPATGQLYGLAISGSAPTYSARLYLLPITTSTTSNSLNARLIGSSFNLAGTVAGFDFDPTTDKIRVVTSTGVNVTINPETGAATTDTPISGIVDAKVTGLAFSNNTAGASSTLLYDLDVANQKIYKQTPAGGVLTSVGLTGLAPLPAKLDSYASGYKTNIDNAKTAAPGGFDIAPNGTALAVLMVNSAPAIPKDGISTNIPSSSVSAVTGTPTLFKIDLATGKATDLGAITIPPSTTANQIIGIAIAPTQVAYAIDNATNNILVFNPINPTSVVEKTVTGLQPNEFILGLDFRSTNGQLFALGASSRLYAIDLGTFAATVVGSQFGTLLSGTAFGFDCNQSNSSAFRVISNTGQNMRINYSTGVATALANITTNSFTANAITNASSSAILYTIDNLTSEVYKQDPETTGTTTFTKVGKLGIQVDAANGFDIGGVSNTAYAVLTANGATRIYQVTLSTGLVVTPVVAFPYNVRGFALAPSF